MIWWLLFCAGCGGLVGFWAAVVLIGGSATGKERDAWLEGYLKGVVDSDAIERSKRPADPFRGMQN